MSTAIWFLVVGALLLAMGLTAGIIRRLPVTTSMLYLAVGMLVGPTFLYAFHFNPLEQSALLEVITEVAVLLSLFTAGMKMPVPFTYARWRTPVLLAFVGMALTATLMTGLGYYALGLPLGGAVLLAGILAPTDPVLATEVQARHPGDRDRLRFGVTCEAGMNDGTAFPVVMLGLGLLGLHDLGAWGWRWLAVDLLWATAAGIALGVVAGRTLAHVVAWQRRARPSDDLMHDFVALGLIGVVYGLSLLIHAWGFLAVFFAAVALRQRECALLGLATDGDPFEQDDTNYAPAPVTDGSLVFNEHLERLSEVVLVLLLGGALFPSSWNWAAVATALFLFFCARPLGVVAAVQGTRTPPHLQALTAWFGVRGIGSLFYLMYAIQHGLPEELALTLLQITLIVVTLSILLHGFTVKPMLSRFRTRHAGAAGDPA